MQEPEITDEQIRIELKRMLAAEKHRILAQFDEHEREAQSDTDIPEEMRGELVEKLRAKFAEARERLDVTTGAFSDFIDRR